MPSLDFSSTLAAFNAQQQSHGAVQKQCLTSKEEIIAAINVNPATRAIALLDSGPCLLVVTVNLAVKKSADGMGAPRLSVLTVKGKVPTQQAFAVKKSKSLRSYVQLAWQPETSEFTMATSDKVYEWKVPATSAALVLPFASLLCATARWSYRAAPLVNIDTTVLDSVLHALHDAQHAIDALTPAQRTVLNHTDNITSANDAAQTRAAAASVESTTAIAIAETDADNIRRFLAQHHLTVRDAHKLESLLTAQLSRLEHASLQLLFTQSADSSSQSSLVRSLDAIIEKCDETAMWISLHDTELHRMRQGIARIEAKNLSLEQQESNHAQLQRIVDQLLKRIQLPSALERALTHPDFSDRLNESLAAAQALDDALAAPLEPSLESMRAVREQRAKFVSLKSAFAAHVRSALEARFTAASKQMEATPTISEPNAATLASNATIHASLLELSGLARFDIASLPALRSRYASVFAKPYEQRIRHFFAELKKLVQIEKHEAGLASFPPFQPGTAAAGMQAQTGATGSAAIAVTRGTNSVCVRGKQIAPAAFRSALTCLLLIIEAEERFLSRFFHASADDVDGVLSELFGSVMPQLTELCSFGARMDAFYALEMEVSSEQFATSPSPFIGRLQTVVASSVHQLFNKFIDEQCAAVLAINQSPKRAGVLMPFQQFPAFVARSESLVHPTRSKAADTAYAKLSVSLFKWLDAVARQDDKYTDVCWVENANYYVTVFTTQFPHEIPALQPSLARARTSCDSHLLSYLNWHLEYELKDVMKFWHRLESALRTMNAEDVQHARELSKHELKTITRDKFSAKQAQKHLSNIHTRIRKHLGTNDALIALVWQRLAQVLVERVRWFETTIAQCYTSEKSGVTTDEMQAILRHASGE